MTINMEKEDSVQNCSFTQYDNGIENQAYNVGKKDGLFTETKYCEVNMEDEDTPKTEESKESKVKLEADGTHNDLIYQVTDAPPIHLTLFFGLQQALLSLSSSLTVSLLVAEFVCAEHSEELKSKLLSSTLFMNGITTLLMVTLGVRLPLYQGATPTYVVPLIALGQINADRCKMTTNVFNATSNTTDIHIMPNEEVATHYIRMLQGSLIAAGLIHFTVGATGLVGVLLRFIGPVTIVPTILLLGIYITKPITKFAQVHWGVACLTCATAVILSLYLRKVSMPIPAWSRKKSFYIVRYPFHQVFAILIAIIVGWVTSAILTEAGVFDSGKSVTDKLYYARTDVRSYVIKQSPWFNFPYPGQYGPIGFSVSAFIGYLVATIISILDSIGDYYACASICRVPPPPSHAVNRGISIEGMCTSLSGAVGCGHATSTIGANIGAIGLTRVASRRVFVCVAIMYLIFGMINKVSAVFITIPHPVLGGVLIIMFGVFSGVILSNLKSVDLSSTRNLAIIGLSLMVGLIVPHWVKDYPDSLNIANKDVNDMVKMILSNPNLSGGLVACILDNTIPGTKDERGITAWQNVSPSASEDGSTKGNEVYQPLLPRRLARSRLVRYLPFMPKP